MNLEGGFNMCRAGRQQLGTLHTSFATASNSFTFSGWLRHRTRPGCSPCHPEFGLGYTWEWPRGTGQWDVKQKIKQM